MNSIHLQVFLDKFIDREVKSLVLHCINYDQGCNWKGELSKREVIFVITVILLSFIKSLTLESETLDDTKFSNFLFYGQNPEV